MMSIFFFFRSYNSYLVELDSSLHTVWLSQCNIFTHEIALGSIFKKSDCQITFSYDALYSFYIFWPDILAQPFLVLVSLDMRIIWLSTYMRIILTPDFPKGIQDCKKLPCYYSPSWKIAWSDVTTSDIQLSLTLKHHLQKMLALGIVLFELWQLHLII